MLLLRGPGLTHSPACLPGRAGAAPAFHFSLFVMSSRSMTFRFPVVETRAVVSGCLHSLTHGPWRRPRRAGRPVPAHGGQLSAEDTWMGTGARQRARLHPGGMEAPGSGVEVWPRRPPNQGLETLALPSDALPRPAAWCP